VVNLDQPGFLSLHDVLAILPVSRSSWYAGIKKGIYPAAVSMGGLRKVGWKTQEIRELVDRLEV
jgi:predicted DNA-binding transcriptional regulator AlpA